MTGILDKFHVEHSSQGTRILARSQQLTSILDDEENVDAMVAMLKDDLDACGREMKRLIKANSRGALFEGWTAQP